MHKLSPSALKHRINEYQNRVKTLSDIICDVSDKNAKATLETHIQSYKKIISDLEKELQSRNK